MKNQPKGQEIQEKVSCYKCASTGYYARDCPEDDANIASEQMLQMYES